MKTAELHHAYVWDCDDCGTENFVRAIRVEMSEEEEMEIMEEVGVEAFDDEGYWEQIPSKVTCKSCKKEYRTLED